MNYSLPGSSMHGIFQARVLESVASSFSRGSSQPRDQTWLSHIAGRHFTVWATRETLPLQWRQQFIAGYISAWKTPPYLTELLTAKCDLVTKFQLRLKVEMVYNFQKESLKEGKFPSMLSFISCWLECRWNGWMPHTLWICDKEAKQPPMTKKTETSHHLWTHEREVISGLFQATLIWRPWFHTDELIISNKCRHAGNSLFCQVQIKVW